MTHKTRGVDLSGEPVLVEAIAVCSSLLNSDAQSWAVGELFEACRALLRHHQHRPECRELLLRLLDANLKRVKLRSREAKK